MTIVTCDVCGKKLTPARRGDTPGKGVSYVTYLDRDICSECADEVDFNLRRLTRHRDPFVLLECKDIHTQLVQQMTKAKE
jgi:hypothetical protein